MSDYFKKKVEIQEIHPTQSYGQNGFQKRILIGKTIEQNAQELPFEFQFDSVDLLDSYKLGEEITVSFSLRCKGYQKTPADEKKYFPALVAFAIEPKR